MKTCKKLSLFSMIVAYLLITISCNTNTKEAEAKQECPFESKEKVAKWEAEFQNPVYEIYQNFNNIPFPKIYVEEKPFPENKHIIFYFGLLDETVQTYYLFTGVIEDLPDSKTKLDYNTLMYFDKENQKWVPSNNDDFELAKLNWSLFVQEQKLLPTLGYTLPNEDINICPHKSFDIIKLGVDNSNTDKNTWLKLYFNESGATDDDVVSFDACLPCPPTCLQ